ncbi:hypothetical protein CALVIDRAFT_232513 [Calocera viscosa TUFC12733]|uniref:Secreted protein n=1 Tax=Calocera viscosa (strain TUFC12733) TaxID=1330018 RepID=A0A167JXC5_CALVF|nr:hypothetical protein CALVIDRAFT_232513 [Calocera viscosa TUFC12733]
MWFSALAALALSLVPSASPSGRCVRWSFLMPVVTVVSIICICSPTMGAVVTGRVSLCVGTEQRIFSGRRDRAPSTPFSSPAACLITCDGRPTGWRARALGILVFSDCHSSASLTRDGSTGRSPCRHAFSTSPLPVHYQAATTEMLSNMHQFQSSIIQHSM